MVEYSLINEKKEWNDSILKYVNNNPYQLYEWGEYKENMGWKVASIKANDNGNMAFLQITYKLKFNCFIGWCIGSISGDCSLFQKDQFIQFLQTQFDAKYIFIKGNFTNLLEFDESLKLYTAGWSKSCKKINSEYTINVDLTQDKEQLLASCSKNFRKNITRGESKNTQIKIEQLSKYKEEDIVRVFKNFNNIKDVQLPDIQEITLIKEKLGNHIIVASSMIDGEIVGLRAYLYFSNKAIDFWAATDKVGRSNYTSYILLFNLLLHAKELGVEIYDMSGINPKDNKSVYAFKNGLRAEVIEKLGEWEITNSKLLSFLINKVYL